MMNMMSTMSDAHREWHRNTDTPMGTPGCPQDACHPPYDFFLDEADLVKCGNRKAHPEGDYHYGVEGVRACYGATVETTPEVACSRCGRTLTTANQPHTVTDLYNSRQCAPEPVPVASLDKSAFSTWSTIPVGDDGFGDYALEIGGKVRFFNVNRPAEGTWSGYTFVKEYAGDDLHKPQNWAEILTLIAADPEAAAALYGRETKRCFRCHRKLTRPESRERGMGPVCATKAGW